MTKRCNFEVSNPPKYIVNFRTLPIHFKWNLMNCRARKVIMEILISFDIINFLPCLNYQTKGIFDVNHQDKNFLWFIKKYSFILTKIINVIFNILRF